MNTLCPISATNSYCRPFRFKWVVGGQVQIDRINLPWGYMDSNGLPNVYVKDHQSNVRAIYKQCMTATRPSRRGSTVTTSCAPLMRRLHVATIL